MVDLLAGAGGSRRSARPDEGGPGCEGARGDATSSEEAEPGDRGELASRPAGTGTEAAPRNVPWWPAAAADRGWPGGDR